MFDESIQISALSGHNIINLLGGIVTYFPEHPAYFPKDQLTDKPERFFMLEIVRENIYEL